MPNNSKKRSRPTSPSGSNTPPAKRRKLNSNTGSPISSGATSPSSASKDSNDGLANSMGMLLEASVSIDEEDDTQKSEVEVVRSLYQAKEAEAQQLSQQLAELQADYNAYKIRTIRTIKLMQAGRSPQAPLTLNNDRAQPIEANHTQDTQPIQAEQALANLVGDLRKQLQEQEKNFQQQITILQQKHNVEIRCSETALTKAEQQSQQLHAANSAIHQANQQLQAQLKYQQSCVNELNKKLNDQDTGFRLVLERLAMEQLQETNSLQEKIELYEDALQQGRQIWQRSLWQLQALQSQYDEESVLLVKGYDENCRTVQGLRSELTEIQQELQRLLDADHELSKKNAEQASEAEYVTQALRSELDDNNQQLQALQHAYDILKQQQSTAETHFISKAAQSKSLEENREKLQKRINMLRKGSRELQQTIQRLQYILNENMAQLLSLQSASNELQQQKEVAETDLLKQTQLCETLSQQISELQRKNDELQKQYQASQAQLQQLTSELEQSISKKDSLQMQLVKLQDNECSLKQDNGELQQRVDALTQEQQAMHLQRETDTSALSRAQQAIESHEKDKVQLQEKNQQLDMQLVSSQQENQQLREQLAQMREELQAERNKCKQLEILAGATPAAKAELAKAQATIVNRNTQIEQYKQEKSIAQQTESTLQQKINALIEENAVIYQQNEEKTAKLLAKHSGEIEELKAQLKVLKEGERKTYSQLKQVELNCNALTLEKGNLIKLYHDKEKQLATRTKEKFLESKNNQEKILQLQNELKTLQRAKEHVDAQLIQEKKSYESLEAAHIGMLEEVKATICRYDAKLQTNVQENADLRSQLEHFKNQTPSSNHSSRLFHPKQPASNTGRSERVTAFVFHPKKNM
jgi:chromosome segregation ATPase